MSRYASLNAEAEGPWWIDDNAPAAIASELG